MGQLKTGGRGGGAGGGVEGGVPRAGRGRERARAAAGVAASPEKGKRPEENQVSRTSSSCQGQGFGVRVSVQGARGAARAVGHCFAAKRVRRSSHACRATSAPPNQQRACMILNAWPGKRSRAAASASSASRPTTQWSMRSLGAPGMPASSPGARAGWGRGVDERGVGRAGTDMVGAPTCSVRANEWRRAHPPAARSRLGFGAPTTAAARCTSPGCSPSTCVWGVGRGR